MVISRVQIEHYIVGVWLAIVIVVLLLLSVDEWQKCALRYEKSLKINGVVEVSRAVIVEASEYKTKLGRLNKSALHTVVNGSGGKSTYYFNWKVLFWLFSK